MSVIQAILIALLYCLEKSEIYVPATYSFLTLQMISALTGLILGDLKTGVIVGATIQPLYLALTSVGGSAPVDKAAAGTIATSAVITQGISFDQALVLSSVAALTLSNLHILNRTLMLFVTHYEEDCCKKGDIPGLTRGIFLYGNIIHLLAFGLPMFIILYWGIGALGFLQNGLPPRIDNILSLMAGLMPAVGFAMTIVVIGKGNLMPFFAAGFFFAKYSGLGTVAALLLGALLAWLYMIFTKKDDEGSIFGDLSVLTKKADLSGRILDKADLRRAWTRWRLSITHVDNVERLQAMGVAYTMSAVLPKLYPNNPELVADGLSRHTDFFCTENMLGGIIPGVLVSLEEERAIGIRKGLPEDELIPVELIDSIKVGTMGPFAGMGDTLNYAVINPLLNAFFMGFGQQGYVWAPFVLSLITYTVWTTEGRLMYNLGYNFGTQAAQQILGSGAYQKIVTFFSILGLFVMGAFAADFVSVRCLVNIPKATDFISLQEVLFDAIVPGLLPFCAQMFTYWHLKKYHNMLKTTGVLALISLVAGGLMILGA